MFAPPVLRAGGDPRVRRAGALRSNASAERFIGTLRPGTPRSHPDYRTTPLRRRAARVCAALQRTPPAPITHQRALAGGIPPRSGSAIRVLRQDRLGGLLHEYLQVAGGDHVLGTHRPGCAPRPRPRLVQDRAAAELESGRWTCPLRQRVQRPAGVSRSAASSRAGLGGAGPYVSYAHGRGDRCVSRRSYSSAMSRAGAGDYRPGRVRAQGGRSTAVAIQPVLHVPLGSGQLG
jgi:hypothetical protein